MEYTAGDLIMPVGEDVGFDHDAISDDPLDRELSVVDLGANSLDDDSAPRIVRIDLLVQTHTS